MSLKTKLAGLRSFMGFDNRWQLLVDRTVFRHTSMFVARYKGMEILLDYRGGDHCGLLPCLVSPMYQAFLRHMRLDGPVTVLDLGASVGGFALMLRALGIEVRRLVCVELNPETASRLRVNVERNPPDTCVDVVNAALCGESRVIELPLGRGNVSDSIYDHAPGAGRVVRRIEGLTLDQICEKLVDDGPIDLCKIDVEGAEYEVFDGPCHQAITRCRYLVMEIHPVRGRDPRRLIEYLVGLGFRVLPASGGEDNVFAFENSRATADPHPSAP